MKLFVLIFTVFLTLFFDIKSSVVSSSLTVMSIIFGFFITYLSSVYTKNDFNKVLKENNQLDNFLNSNKTYLMQMLFSIGIIFLIDMVGNIQMKITIPFFKIEILLQLYAIVVLIFSIMFYNTLKIITDFLSVYKNSYSNYLKMKLKKDDPFEKLVSSIDRLTSVIETFLQKVNHDDQE